MFEALLLDPSVPWRDPLLYGSLTLLAIGLVLRVNRRRHDEKATPAGPDLRWWKEQDYLGA